MVSKLMQFWVGVFILCGFLTLIWLAIKVSGLSWSEQGHYQVTAEFDNIGSLKVRAPVKIAGVVVGRVTRIALDNKTFRARVSMDFSDQYNQLPTDSVANIYTAGLLGANYISLTPGYATLYLHGGGQIETTHSAMILENLLGQLLFSIKGGGSPDPLKGGAKK